MLLAVLSQVARFPPKDPVPDVAPLSTDPQHPFYVQLEHRFSIRLEHCFSISFNITHIAP